MQTAFSVGKYLWNAATAAVRPVKVSTDLDPIYTLCMLAMRHLSEKYKGALPAVRNNSLEFDEAWLGRYGQGALRALYDASFRDLNFVSDSIKFLINGWPAKKNPFLVELATFALEGVRGLKRLYKQKGETDGVNLCRNCKFRLQAYVQEGRSVKPLRLPPVGYKLITELHEEVKKTELNTHPGREWLSKIIDELKNTQGTPPFKRPPKQLSTKQQEFVASINRAWAVVQDGQKILEKAVAYMKMEHPSIKQIEILLKEQKEQHLKSSLPP